MKTLLVIATQSGLADAIRAVVDARRYQVHHARDTREGDAVWGHDRVDACILDAELTTIEPIRTIESIRQRRPNCRILVYAGARQWEWEEEAYLLGVAHVLSKPVRGRLLNSVLDRLWPATLQPAPERPPLPRALVETRPVAIDRASHKTLEVLRDFSALLTHSLCSEALLKQFLQLLRGIIGVNRAVVFLRQPPGALGNAPSDEESRRMRAACAIGLSPDLFGHFALSLSAGVGGAICRNGRILRRCSDEVLENPEMLKEFELVGAEVALPILDGQTVMGVAFFDNRLTGETLTNEEVSLIFYLLEGLGMAIKNIWLHDQVTAGHGMMTDILRHLSSACVVVGRDLAILHANQTALEFFRRPGSPERPLEFGDLPQTLGSKVFEVLKGGGRLEPFKYRQTRGGDQVFQVSITPFQKPAQGMPEAVLLLAEDFTQNERLQELEIEAANLRMIKTMAERLAHEIGNAMVPVSTHQQLLAEKFDDPEFRASLDTALAESSRRISRLGQQMLFLAQDRGNIAEPVTISQLIEDAFQETRKHHQEKSVLLQYESGGPSMVLNGDRAGLKHALAEVILNAVQANPPTPKVRVSTRAETGADGIQWVHIDVQDSGSGFTKEAAAQVPRPFYTTRTVGVGLGLTVCRKIIETHRGRLNIGRSRAGQSGVVTISLPLSGN